MWFLVIPVIIFIMSRGFIVLNNKNQVQKTPLGIVFLSILFLLVFVIKLMIFWFCIDPEKASNYIYINTAIFTIISLGMLLWNQSVGHMDSSFADGICKPKRLIITGSFNLVRNPIYFAYVLCFSVLLFLYPFLFLNNYYLIYLFVECLFFSTGYILLKNRITQEEKVLSEFGNEYIKYKNEVPRLIPTLSSLSNFMKQPFKVK